MMGLVISTIFFVFARSTGLVLACLVVIFAGIEYLAVHFLAVIRRRKPGEMKIAVTGVTLATILSTGFMGYLGWPHLGRHILATIERDKFEEPLKAKKDVTLTIQIACPYTDEKTCVFASQFISLFGESGWNVQPILQRTMLTKANDGIIIYRRGGDRSNSLKRWDAAAYFPIIESHLLAVESAFESIGIELEGGTNPDVPENVMMIYFGQERDNEGRPTDLTRWKGWYLGGQKGPPPWKK